MEEIKARYVFVESMKEQDQGQFNHESELYYQEVDADQDFLAKDNQEFEETREKYISQIKDIAKMLCHNRNMSKIKKECFKNMIAGPSLIDQ